MPMTMQEIVVFGIVLLAATSLVRRAAVVFVPARASIGEGEQPACGGSCGCPTATH